MSPDRQSVFAIVAIIAFATIMGALWILTHGFGQEFGMGVAVGGIFFGAIVTAALGWRRGGFD